VVVQKSDVLANLERDGFSLHRGFAPHLSTSEVGHALGSVVSLEELLPVSGIPTVQSLKPKNTNQVRPNRYSRHYGLGTFPLHTDLAHWALPPRYLLLRCVVGCNDVFTHVLPWTPIVELVGRTTLQKAVLSARKRRIGFSSLVRAMSRHHQAEVLRWDPIFLRPLNQHARALASVMLDPIWNTTAVKILLLQPGDTLVLDNWRMLHGRSQVSAQSTARNIERVYLSEVFL
jgi:alpha-ketoglutarate-dependent taurine dioxygenase